MNRDDIIRIAREAGLERIVGVYADGSRMVEVPNLDLLERFAALVYAEGHKDGLDDFEAGVLPAAIKAEREACAKVCDAYDVAEDVNSSDTAEGIAAAIRARGQS